MNTDLKQWQKRISDDRALFEITIPGTHDCTTQYVQLSRICKCQDLSIREQLAIGVRALDIRVAPDEDRLMLVHSVAKVFATASHKGDHLYLEDVLDSCYRFLDENPSEAIVFQFKNDSNKDMIQSFDNLFYTYIKPNEEKWYCENRIPTLGEARGKLVLIRRCELDINNTDYNMENTGIDFSCWVEQDTVTPEALKLGTGSVDNAVFVIQDRYKYKPKARWNECLKPFLDSANEFNGEYVINYTSTAGGTAGPRNNAKIINAELMNYEFKKGVHYGIIYLDFANPELTTRLIEQNY